MSSKKGKSRRRVFRAGAGSAFLRFLEAARLAAGLREAIPGVTVNQIGSLLCVFFTEGPVRTYADAKRSDTARYGRYFRHMLDRGIYLAPAQFEAMFLGACHTDEDVDRTIEAAKAFRG